MINGVAFNRSAKTDDRKLAETLARKWEHEAVKTVAYDGERPVTLYEAIDSFLAQRKHLPSYGSACQHMQHWKNALPNEKNEVATKASVASSRYQAPCRRRSPKHNLGVRHVLERDDQPLQGQQAVAGPKLDRVQSKRTRFRIINEQEEAAMLAATCPNAIYPGKTPKNDAHRQGNQDLLVCLLHLGARINEAQNLRWSDVDFVNNTILVRRLKGGDDTPLVMTKALRAVLDRRYAGKVDKLGLP